jgi:[phosphatase 2A protein]-leucine-carboxy methyltransferase
MVYLHPQEAETVIKWAGENFKNAVFLNYEQVNMNDTFGSVMINNLKVGVNSDLTDSIFLPI